MNDIKVAMTVNGELYESGEAIRVTDEKGVKCEGLFIRAYPDSNIPNRMNMVIKLANKQKVVVNATDAKTIEKG